MSPRRSSRARSSQQPTAPSQANSSSSSTTAKDSRTPRATLVSRSTSEAGGSVKRSESIDDADSMARSDQNAPRRSRRGAEIEREVVADMKPEEDDENEVIEDDVTRCICGHADYPGPSITIREQYGTAALTEDMGNFFVQCNNCHVWQHGGCLGIPDESVIPEEYYCEKCRPDFHKVIKASNIGTKCSKYLPVLEGTAANTPLTAADQARMKEMKHKALMNTKRRATMNSRGAYDEDEMLRQAIEESKAEGSLGKRTRDDSEDRRPSNKRQRTGSSNSDMSSKKSHSPEPERVATGKNGAKLRGAAARNSREKEIREKQKQEAMAQRAEAASKRNARSERRRVDDSPPPTPTLSPSKPVENKNGKGKAETPQPSKAKPKGGARPGARGKRVGRNQYTKDLYESFDAPHRSDSRDGNHNSPYGMHDKGRSSKARTHPARTSLNEMKRRVAGILEIVSQMQTSYNKLNNIATSGSSTSHSSDNGKGNSTPNVNSRSVTSAPSSKMAEIVTASLQNSDTSVEDGKSKAIADLDFGKMGSAQMMETLTNELVGWQTQFGVYSR